MNGNKIAFENYRRNNNRGDNKSRPMGEADVGARNPTLKAAKSYARTDRGIYNNQPFSINKAVIATKNSRTEFNPITGIFEVMFYDNENKAGKIFRNISIYPNKKIYI